MRLIMLIVYLILILLGVSFAALNATPTQLNLYVTTLSLPVSVLMIVTFGIGLLLGLLLFVCRYWRLKRAFLKVNTQLKQTEMELKNFSAMSLKEHNP